MSETVFSGYLTGNRKWRSEIVKNWHDFFKYFHYILFRPFVYMAKMIFVRKTVDFLDEKLAKGEFN